MYVPSVSSSTDQAAGTCENLSVGLNRIDVSVLNGAVVGRGVAETRVEGTADGPLAVAGMGCGAWLPGEVVTAHPANTAQAAATASTWRRLDVRCEKTKVGLPLVRFIPLIVEHP
jgi:hypothetical protein